MASTRARALDAALALLGDEGIRALTHSRVDARAELPRGSTSNWFRTRDALIAGVITHLAESERADFAAAAEAGTMPVAQTPEQLVEAFTGMIAAQAGPFAARTRARYAMFLEGAGDPELLAPLVQQRHAYVQWTTGLLAAVGARAPEEAARTLMAAAEGLVLHLITVDPGAEIRPVVERAVRACVG